jgi:hypothetical protein
MLVRDSRTSSANGAFGRLPLTLKPSPVSAEAHYLPKE